jgi:CDP-diacylglycerol---glycerol-3-phosphate 3-phosphatidyltransferase
VDKLTAFRKSLGAIFTQPVVRLLSRTSITPNTVTWVGFLIITGAAVLAGLGYFLFAGLVVLLAGYFDIIDGALARQTQRVTRFGGVLDSTLDRLSEAVVLIGLMAYYIFRPEISQPWIILLLGLSMISSFLVSYIRARAEGAGVKCEVGISTRTERVLLLALGLIINQVLIALLIITLMSAVTVVQRLAYVYRETRRS